MEDKQKSGTTAPAARGMKGLAPDIEAAPSPRHARLESELAGLLATAERQEGAVLQLREAIRLAGAGGRPVDSGLLEMLEEETRSLAKTWTAASEVYGELGRWEEGAAWARRVRDLAWDEESRADATLMLAVMLERSDWPAEALQAFQWALAHGLGDPRLVAGASIGAADCLLALDRPREAEAFCHAALAAEPDNSTALFALVRCLIRQGEWEAAARCLVGACDREVPGASLMLYGLMDHVQSLPGWNVFMPELKALFDDFRARAAERARTTPPDA